MKKIAIIRQIENDTIYATYNKDNSDGHSKAFFKTREDLTFKVKNSRALDLTINDSIEIFIEPKSAISLSFFMFIMPLIIFMGFYSIVGVIAQNSSEFTKILTGILGIVTSFFLTYVFFKIRPQKLPEIVRVLSKQDLLSLSCSSSSCGSCKSCG